ncbi:MAG: choice-of-anchor B family protein, partial [Planctomycetota bacterium]|nr:choice-of-anchor B family protein [Planctomycetota bacterium]
MKRRYVCANGGASWAALVSLGIIFAAVLSAYANREASKPNMPPDGVAAGTPASRAAVAAANGNGGGIAGCPAGGCDLGDCTLTQSLDTVTDGLNQVACGVAGVGTTANGWARCYNLVNEGVPAGQNLTINSVTFGVAQATINGINIDVSLYVDNNGCPPVEPGVDAALIASQSVVVNTADEGSMITVEFPEGPVIPAGSDFIVEIISVDDGTIPPEFQFRAMSNANGQCGPSYIRTPNGDCGLAGWTDLAAIGFPDAHLVQVINATVGGIPGGACCMGDESCQFLNEAACNAAGGTYQGDGTGCAGGICDIIPEACGPGAGSCQEPNPTPGCDDEDCCAGVCDINPACCSLQWDALCVQIASKLLECSAGFPAKNVSLYAHFPVQDFNAEFAEDSWGYVSPSGREYAIIGLSTGTGFIEITDPANPVIIDVVLTPNQGRDMKVFGHYVYSSSDAGPFHIIDVQDIDNGVVTLANTIEGGTHNISINEQSGFLYASVGGAMVVLSLADPVNPELVAIWEGQAHDAQVVTYTEGRYAGREIAFVFAGSSHNVDIVDVTDKSDMFLVGSTTYPNAAYTHQGWLSGDRKYLYVSDELDDIQRTNILDVSDLSNPFPVGEF